MKRIPIFLLATLLLVLVAVLIAPRFIHTELFKKNLETYLSQRIHRQVRFTGDLSFRFLPWVGFKAAGLRVANAPGFGATAMVTCEKADVQIELLPLLEKRVVFQEIALHGAVLHLMRNRYGRTNWKDLVDDVWGAAPVRPSQPFVLGRVGEVRIRRSALIYTDALEETEIALGDLELDRHGQVQLEFRIAGTLNAKGRPRAGFTAVAGKWNMAGSAYVDTRSERFAVTASDFSFPFELTGQNGMTLAGEIASRFTCDTATETLALTRTEMKIGSASVSGDFHARKVFHQPSLRGRVRAASADLPHLLKSLQLQDRLSVWRPPASGAVAFAYTLDGKGLTLEDLDLRLEETALRGRMTLAHWNRPEIHAILSADRIDLDPLLGESTDPKSTRPPSVGTWDPGGSIELDLTAGALSVRGIEVNDLQLQFRAGDGRLACSPVSFAFAGGAVRGEVDAVILKPSLVVKTALRFDAVSTDSLWRLAGQKAPVSARLSGEMNLITEGEHIAELKDGLSGTVRIEAPDGLVIPRKTGRNQEKVRIGKAAAVLAAYVHGDPSRPGENAPAARSFSLDLSADALAPEVTGSLHARGIARIFPGFDGLAASVAELRVSVAGQALGPASPLELDGAGSLDSRTGAFSLDRFAFHGLGLSGSGRVANGQFRPGIRLAGHLKVNNFDPRDLGDRLGLRLDQSPDPGVFQHARAEADFRYDSANLSLDRLQAAVDDTRLAGNLSLMGLPRPRVDLWLSGDRLDLDRYLAAGKKAQTSEASSGGEASAARRRFADRRIHAAAVFEHLKIADIRLAHPDLAADLEKGVVDLRLHSAELYGGAATGDATVDLAADPMKASAALRLREVDLTGLLTDMFQWVPVSGSGALDLALTGTGNDFSALSRGARGLARVSIADGAIHGIRAVPDSARRQGDREKEKKKTGGGDQEPFDIIQGTVAIDGGVLKSTDGKLTAPQIKATGTGSLNLLTDTLNYAVTADIQNLPVVTYTFTGPLDNLQVRLDRAGFAREAAKGILKSPFKLGRGTLDIGSGILEVGKEAIGDRTGLQRAGQGALNVGKGLLDIGKGVLGLDEKTGETVGTGAKEVGRGIADVGKGVVDTGSDVLETFGGGLKKLFQGAPKEEKAPAEEAKAGKVPSASSTAE